MLEIRASNILKQLNSYYATGEYVCPSEDNDIGEANLTPCSTIVNTLTQVIKNQKDNKIKNNHRKFNS